MASDACCQAGKPVTVDYEPVGTVSSIDDLSVYKTGQGQAAIIVIYDIFGFNYKQVFQVCDRLAEGGFTVSCPDTFRGQAWTLDRFPPQPEHDFRGWINSAGAWERVSVDVYKVVEQLRAQGVAKFGIVGFCWGSSIAIAAGADPTFSAVGNVHPAYFGREKELSAACQAPVCLLPASGDPMEALKEVFDGKPFADKCVYKRFDEQTHGFCAARGDWAVAEVAEGATAAIAILKDFFKRNLQ